MAPQHETTLEAQDEVLADGLDSLQPTPVELLGNACRLGARIRALDLHGLAHEHLEASSGAVKGITLGHAPDCE